MRHRNSRERNACTTKTKYRSSGLRRGPSLERQPVRTDGYATVWAGAERGEPFLSGGLCGGYRRSTELHRTSEDGAAGQGSSVC